MSTTGLKSAPAQPPRAMSAAMAAASISSEEPATGSDADSGARRRSAATDELDLLCIGLSMIVIVWVSLKVNEFIIGVLWAALAAPDNGISRHDPRLTPGLRTACPVTPQSVPEANRQDFPSG